jgi:hypothetical protein
MAARMTSGIIGMPLRLRAAVADELLRLAAVGCPGASERFLDLTADAGVAPSAAPAWLLGRRQHRPVGVRNLPSAACRGVSHGTWTAIGSPANLWRAEMRRREFIAVAPG